MEVWERDRSSLVLAGDTVVVLGGEVLGKPADSADAQEMLMALSGKTHTVVSGLALCFPNGSLHSGFDRTGVTFRAFEEATAAAYVSTGEPMDKAGAYGIQGLGSALVRGVQGDYNTVVGLPVPLLLELFSRGGLRYKFGGLVPVSQEETR
jgi:septum formation protein